jgi:hypothetical protein
VPDVLLRERALVLTRTLQAVERVIDVLERSRMRADAVPTASGNAAALLASATGQIEVLTTSTAGVQFPLGAKREFDVGLASLRADLEELGRQLQAPPTTSRVTLRLDQLTGTLTDAVKDRRRDLKKLVDDLDRPDGLPDEAARAKAWKDCRKIEAECRRLFADYLDLVRGVALRDSGLDDGLCRIADRLIVDLGPFGVTTWESLTVPASREWRGGPAASIVRIGFPEWSVWTLPLVAVEFASFLVAQHKRFIDFHEEVVEELERLTEGEDAPLSDAVLASLIDRKELVAEGRERDDQVEEALERLTEVLLVEVLSTAMIGPAYAWSALLMRVDPCPGEDVLERLRRASVVAALARVPERGRGATRCDLLASEWDALLATAGIEPPGAIDVALEPIVALVADGVVDRMPVVWEDTDWMSIERLANQLGRAPVKEALDAEPRRPTLQHVLNAGWVARLERPEMDRTARPDQGAPPLSQAVHDMCVELLKPQVVKPAGTGPTPGANPTLPDKPS